MSSTSLAWLPCYDLEVYLAIHVNVNEVWAMSILVDTWLMSLIRDKFVLDICSACSKFMRCKCLIIHVFCLFCVF